MADNLSKIAVSITENGPLFCRAVVPSFASDAWRENDYSPWFVCHTDWEMLHDEVISRIFQDFRDESDLEAFFKALEIDHGYLVLDSGPGGVCWLE